MRFTSTVTTLSPTDLSGFAECSHRTLLDFAAARKLLPRPGRNQIEVELLEKRGRDHEARVLAHFGAEGLEVHTTSLHLDQPELAAQETAAAMERGFDVIYQGTLLHEGWVGRPDFLLKVEEGHYEPADAKLARSAKAAAVLQLCAYVEALGATQARVPEHFHLALGTLPLELPRLRAAEFMAYYRRAKAQLADFVRAIGQHEDLAASLAAAGEKEKEAGPSAASPGPSAAAPGASSTGLLRDSGLPYPEPVSHCGVCPWWKRCEDRRRVDDHLSLVAGITRKQRERLTDQGTTRLAELAALSPSVSVPGIEPQPLARIREQARIQVEGRDEDHTKHELLTEFDPGSGLEALPQPCPGDLFFDLEGDAFYESTGLEYLFGLVELGQISRSFVSRTEGGPPHYLSHWAASRAEEKSAFEAVIDRIQAGRNEFPELHVYHFGHREADAVRRLSCFHKTREDVVDDMLRNKVFVDLHRIVRQSLRASVESYSLKLLEPLYGFTRKTEVRDAARAMQLFGRYLELGGPDGSDDARAVIASYNEEDCLSTWKLREFLEGERPRLEATLKRKLTRPTFRVVEPPARDNRELQHVVEDLTRELPEDPGLDSQEQAARRLLANLLEWHWREEKSGWWEYYRALELTPSERLEDSAALSGLTHTGVVGTIKRSHVHRYEFPPQRHGLRASAGAVDPDTGHSVDLIEVGPDFVHVLRGPGAGDRHPSALIPGGPVRTGTLKKSLLELGRRVADSDDGALGAQWDLLRRSAPRLMARSSGKRAAPRVEPSTGSEASLKRAGEDEEAALVRVALALDGSVVSVQGPPGSGKTHLAAKLIGALVAQGHKVGVSANSHQVIKNLLAKVIELKQVRPDQVRHYDTYADKRAFREGAHAEAFALESKYDVLRTALDSGKVLVAGGTAWAWANDALAGSVDFLVIDEAGQTSLANVVSACRGARNLILVGDPAQLDQPTKGVHPPGSEVSALEHIMGDAKTMPEHLGLFLPQTRRLHPEICAFTSEVFYEGRLQPLPGLERQILRAPSPTRLLGAGLRFVPIEHRANTDQSEQEADAVATLIQELLDSGAEFVSAAGKANAIRPDDVLVVAPFNTQVNLIRSKVPAGIRVGTVDKFQGKEAPVVLYSLASSSIEDAPRGISFLFNPSRLNVATSRARALAVVVASPELLAARCRTPEQIKLANALCAFVERAETLTWST